MSKDDHAADALDEIRRRRRALRRVRDRALVDQRTAEAREFYRAHPEIGVIVAAYVYESDRLTLTLHDDDEPCPVPAVLTREIIKLAALKLAELTTEGEHDG